jgi:FKBP-type peptidyl-prolyl cis-trans isomerase
MIKNLFFAFFIILVVAAGCKKDDNTCGYSLSNAVAPAIEQQKLGDSLTAMGIDATLAAPGFYYKINEPGDGAAATSPCSTLAVFYRGGFLDGRGFDSTSSGQPAIFQLWQVIAGWQEALPLIKKGGGITLYIPPSLGYGSKSVEDTAGHVLIPANSNLVFDVVLADVQ